MKKNLYLITALISLFTVATITCKERAASGAGDQQEVAQKTDKGNGKNQMAIIKTRHGNIKLEFFPEVAPNHVKNFVKLAKEGFYDGTIFHRVIPGFMIQGGDPKTKDIEARPFYGTGGPGYMIDAEFNNKPHARGILSMARSADPNSAGSQFFICVADSPFLDGQYTVFGQVVEGMDVVDKIVNEARDERDNPLERVEMEIEITEAD